MSYKEWDDWTEWLCFCVSRLVRNWWVWHLSRENHSAPVKGWSWDVTRCMFAGHCLVLRVPEYSDMSRVMWRVVSGPKCHNNLPVIYSDSWTQSGLVVERHVNVFLPLHMSAANNGSAPAHQRQRDCIDALNWKGETCRPVHCGCDTQTSHWHVERIALCYDIRRNPGRNDFCGPNYTKRIENTIGWTKRQRKRKIARET